MPEFHDRNYHVTHMSDPGKVLFATPFWTDAHGWIDDHCAEHRTRAYEFCVTHPINPIDM